MNPEIVDYFSRVSQNTSYGLSFVAIAILLFLVAMGGALLVIAFRFKEKERLDPRRSSHPELLDELCLAHQLDDLQREMLLRIAPLAGAPQPGYLFVRADLFAVGAERWTQLHVGEPTDRLESLFQKLFPNPTESPREPKLAPAQLSRGPVS